MSERRRRKEEAGQILALAAEIRRNIREINRLKGEVTRIQRLLSMIQSVLPMLQLGAITGPLAAVLGPVTGVLSTISFLIVFLTPIIQGIVQTLTQPLIEEQFNLGKLLEEQRMEERRLFYEAQRTGKEEVYEAQISSHPK